MGSADPGEGGLSYPAILPADLFATGVGGQDGAALPPASTRPGLAAGIGPG